MPNPVLTRIIDRLAARQDLDVEEAAELLDEIMGGRASEAETAAALIALRTKGETVEEVVGLASTMRRLARPVETGVEDLLDTAGTGGGGSTYNVSTTAALIAAGAGCPVAKHGNRSATSPSGSADVLEALGVSIDLSPEEVARCIAEVGFGFMFAPAHHGATRYVVPVRRALGVRTIFNTLGPLTNPAGANRQLIGVADPDLIELVAAALARLGARRALIVSSLDGLDEMSSSANTRVVEVRETGLRSYEVSPEDVGLGRSALSAVAGGSPEANADVVRRVLAGERGPYRDIAVLNAGAAIYVGADEGTLEEGVRAAEAAIDDGRAAAVLDRLIAFTSSVVGAR